MRLMPETTPQHASRRLFHYTRASNFLKILRAGFIKLATEIVAAKERPVVWFSFNPHWEPTASPGCEDPITGVRRTVNFEELTRMDAPIRIEIPETEAAHDWNDFKRLSHCPHKTWRNLSRTARAAGSDPKDWRVSFEAVPRTDWRCVEIFMNGDWEPLDPESFLAQFGGGDADNAGKPAASSNEVEELLDTQTHEQLRRAEVIIGTDAQTGSEHVFYGGSVFEEIAKSGVGKNIRTYRFEYDSATSGLAQWIGVIKEAKGACSPPD